jgi:Outer membrane efflux protein
LLPQTTKSVLTVVAEKDCQARSGCNSPGTSRYQSTIDSRLRRCKCAECAPEATPLVTSPTSKAFYCTWKRPLSCGIRLLRVHHWSQNNLGKEKLVLARAIGLPLGQQFEVTSNAAYQELSTSSLEEAIDSAYNARADFQSQVNRVRSAEHARNAASAERYPSLGVETDYGLSGVNRGSSHGTVDAAATLHIPIFQGGRVHGDVLRADALLAEERQ